jgi:hypothetical protein
VDAEHPAFYQSNELDATLAEVLEKNQLPSLRRLKLTRLMAFSNNYTESPLWLDVRETVAAGRLLGVVVETHNNNCLFDDDGMVVLRRHQQ